MGKYVVITLPIGGEPFQGIGLVFLLLVVFRLILGPYLASHGGALVFGEHSVADKFHLVDIERRRMMADATLGLGLGNGWIILGIMTMSTITDDVNHTITSEGLTPFGGESTHGHDGIDVVTIDMKDRGPHTFGHTE